MYSIFIKSNDDELSMIRIRIHTNERPHIRGVAFVEYRYTKGQTVGTCIIRIQLN